MNCLFKLILSFCILAGLSAGMAHKVIHGNQDECTSHHSSESGSHSHDDGDKDGNSSPHHHDCCHLPSADQPLSGFSLPVSFHSLLVEISSDHSLAPDSPVFAMDKPPLI
ncbi:MAG: hypothetical protein H7Y36_04025 [Armatimonadetes bacterium]|nr:hypothetical protein [Akkermansiaceae bacterium]